MKTARADISVDNSTVTPMTENQGQVSFFFLKKKTSGIGACSAAEGSPQWGGDERAGPGDRGSVVWLLCASVSSLG